jgi:hypothetical protein
MRWEKEGSRVVPIDILWLESRNRAVIHVEIFDQDLARNVILHL